MDDMEEFGCFCRYERSIFTILLVGRFCGRREWPVLLAIDVSCSNTLPISTLYVCASNLVL